MNSTYFPAVILMAFSATLLGSCQFSTPLRTLPSASSPIRAQIPLKNFSFKEWPVVDGNGNQKYYTEGEQKGKPIIAHAKENPKRGYHLGMANSYRMMYRRLRATTRDPYVTAITAPLNNSSSDCLYRYRRQFRTLGLDIENSRLDRLRATYLLLFELGVRESDGRYFCGVDLGPNKPGAEKAALASKDPKYAVEIANTSEAGLFQSSWNMASKGSLASQLTWDFKTGKRTDGLLDIFKEGFSKPDWIKHGDLGSGPGREFQRLAKDHPNFAVEFAALTSRNRATWYFFTLHNTMDFSPEVLEWLVSLEPSF